MSQDFRSPHWYRVAALRPRLAPQVVAQRQLFRGEAWYVLYDPVNQRTMRLSPPAWQVVSRMDGSRSVETLWRDAVQALGTQAPPQDELIQLLAQLHESDLLLSDAFPDLDELLRRRDRQRHDRWKRNLLNPLAIRFRVWDPDRFLVRTLPAVGWLFGPVGALLWLLVTLPALVLTAMHWVDLTHNASDRLLSAANLATTLIVYPLVKALHELAHAYAVRRGGAAVHDMGLMFLVFAPVPYVDASGSSAFADKRQRALVAAAGMLTELFLAALALQVWLAVEPGMVRSLAFSVMVIGGVSTLLFNGNPLLRYDGYFVLCDLIESPNLAQRANQFWLWLVRRHAFGLRQAQPPRATPGERVWFTVYAPLAFAYRVAITCGIALFLGQEYLYVGMGIGLWGLATMLLWPLAKGLRYLASSPELSGRRARPVALAGGAMALLMAGLLAVPAPLATYAQGLVWPADNAQLRAAEAGFVERLAVLPGQAIHAGEAVLRMRNDGAQTDRDAAQARDERQRRGYIAALAGTGAERDLGHARVATEVRHQEWLRAADELDHARQTVDRLTVSARRDGRVELPRADDLPGRWLKKGELFGHLVTDDAPTVRVVVTQDDIALVRAGTGRIEVRLAGDPATVWIAQQRHEVPGGDDSLPAMALTLDGGGLIAADTRDPARPRALNRVFQFDLELPTAARAARIGERAHVRFVHADEPLAVQWARRLRQLLLSRLGL